MLRIKAKISLTSKNYRRPILFNPGEFTEVALLPALILLLLDFQAIVKVRGSIYTVGELGEECDIVGFDPRGLSSISRGYPAFMTLFRCGGYSAACRNLLWLVRACFLGCEDTAVDQQHI
jgi:hypothetical protein